MCNRTLALVAALVITALAVAQPMSKPPVCPPSGCCWTDPHYCGIFDDHLKPVSLYRAALDGRVR